MITIKLKKQTQEILPEPVLAALHVREGDVIAFDIQGDRVVMMRAGTEVQADPFATFEEWSSDEDQQAYANL